MVRQQSIHEFRQQNASQEAEMSPVWVSKQTAAPNIDPGSYVLELINVREVQVDDFDNPGQKAARIELTFAIREDAAREGAQFTDLCTVRLGPKSKLGQIMSALNGGMPVPDAIDLETAISRRMRAAIRRKDNGFNQVIAETATPVAPVDSDKV
jgi:hypothetical protein